MEAVLKFGLNTKVIEYCLPQDYGLLKTIGKKL